jgi:hypothetical protein
MASLAQERNGNYHIVFWFGGSRFKRSLKTNSLKKSHAAKARLEDTLQLVEIGRLEVPEAADVATFLLSDGKQESKPVFKETRLNPLFDLYFSSMPTGSLEAGTIDQHLAAHLGVFCTVVPASDNT